MEEYIKILEEIVETYRSCSVNEEGFDMKVDIGFTGKECEALENLIAGYKNYKQFESISVQKVKDKMEELNKEIKSCDVTEAIFKIKQQQILQELLESEV